MVGEGQEEKIEEEEYKRKGRSRNKKIRRKIAKERRGGRRKLSLNRGRKTEREDG